MPCKRTKFYHHNIVKLKRRIYVVELHLYKRIHQVIIGIIHREKNSRQ